MYVIGPYLQQHVSISSVHICMVLFWTKCAWWVILTREYHVIFFRKQVKFSLCELLDSSSSKKKFLASSLINKTKVYQNKLNKNSHSESMRNGQELALCYDQSIKHSYPMSKGSVWNSCVLKSRATKTLNVDLLSFLDSLCPAFSTYTWDT